MLTIFAGTYELDASGCGVLTMVHKLPSQASTDSETEPDTATTTAKYRFVIADKGAGLKAMRLEQGMFVVSSFARQ